MVSIVKPMRALEWSVFIITLLLLFLVLTFGVYRFFPVHENANPPVTWGFSVDWKGCIRPDILTLLRGGSPYQGGCGLNPPWTYVLLAPIALLPPAMGAAIIFVLTYFGYTFTLIRLGFKPLFIGLFLLSPLILINATNGNIDWLVVLGYGLPAPIGLFLVLMKPQLGIGIAIFWLIEAWRAGGIKRAAWTFAPVLIAFLISFVFYGLWPLYNVVNMGNDPYNATLFPLSVPLGAILLWLSIRHRKKTFAIASSPFFAPYVNIHSFAVAMFGVPPDPLVLSIVIALLWAMR